MHFGFLHCGSVAVADEPHMIFECPALQAVRQRYASLSDFVFQGHQYHEIHFCTAGSYAGV